MSAARDRVVAAAGEMYAEFGFAGVSQRDLAAKLSIQAPSLYSHFPTQYAILEAVLAPYTETLRGLRTDKRPVNVIEWGKATFEHAQIALIAHHDPSVRHTPVGRDIADQLTGIAADLCAVYGIEMPHARLVCDVMTSPTFLRLPDIMSAEVHAVVAQLLTDTRWMR